MANYKEKRCLLCKFLFIPSSPKQKYCVLCKEEGRKISDRARDKKRSRIKNGYTEYDRICPACGSEFKTYYKKKKYCGSVHCSKTRVSLKNKSYHLVRDKHYMRKKAKDYYIDNKEKCCHVKALSYRMSNTNVKEYVYGKKVHIHTIEYVRTYLENRGYKLLSEDYINCNSKIKVVCPEGHHWETTFHAFQDKDTKDGISNGARCFTCYISNNYTSKPEQKVRDYFLNNYPELEVVYNDRKQIYPKELDLYFSKQKVAIEICGLYWHSEESGKPNTYHYNKMMLCKEKGIRLFTIFEDEIRDKFDVVISRILQALQLTPNRIYARKCEVREIENSIANPFLDSNHIQGRSNAIKSFGLFYKDSLISVATIGKINRKHTSTEDTIELKRFCTLSGITVVGGASRLFKYIKEFAISNGNTIIKSYCDMRYANVFNPIYETLGFSLAGETKYSPHYVKNGIRYRNFSLRKTPEERLTGKTEAVLREEQGYNRIWDCGHRTYVYKL